MVVLVWRQSCPIAMCSVAPVCSATASPHVGNSVCLLAAASGSSHGLAWVPGMWLAKASGRVDVFTQGLQGECCDITCRQPRLTMSRSKRQLAWICLGVLPQQGKDFRTGERLHPGLGATAETTPKALLLLVWAALSRLLAADGKTALPVLGSWLRE